MKDLLSKSNQLAILVDPDKLDSESKLDNIVAKAKEVKANFFLVGSSLLLNGDTDRLIIDIKKKCDLPILLFPGNGMQISKEADGILLLSLISGRNPEFLIGQHVQYAGKLKQSKLDIIPTGYILIENGTSTSVQYMSNTQPIPRSKKDIALATALAGEQLGMECLYLEAGSGAKESVPFDTISLVKKETNIPLFVGGGIKSKDQAEAFWKAGANIVVIGTAFETNN